MTNIEKEILDIINNAVEGKYIGELKVYEDDGVWYLLLHLGHSFDPIVIAKQCDYETFKVFINNEIKNRQLEKVDFWKAIQTYPNIALKNKDYE